MDSLPSTRTADLTHDGATLDAPVDASNPPRPRGFAALSADERRRLGSKGGTAAHARGTANRFTPESRPPDLTAAS
jgi:hypothetical protein